MKRLKQLVYMRHLLSSTSIKGTTELVERIDAKICELISQLIAKDS